MLLWVELTFVGVVAIIVGAYWLFIGSQESREQAALHRRLKGDRKSTLRAKVSVAREVQPLSNIGPLETVLGRFGSVSTPIQRLLSEADVNLTAGAFVLMTVAAFLLGTVIA